MRLISALISLYNSSRTTPSKLLADRRASGWHCQVGSFGRAVAGCVMTISPNPYRGFRFPPAVIEHAVWLYHCFSLSLRDV
jgi:hypothetical protein